MAVVLALGVLLVLAGVILLLNLFGAGDYVVRRVTSRSLGELAPGYAATPRGFKTYAVLVLSVGALCAGIGLTAVFVPVAAGVIVLAAVTFGLASMIAIAGEVETYRALKR
ncbi:MAG TPA: hypothetical protein VLU92_00095 [Candidatus Dormibacteraeota bacterium]|nr:hypothetical protein [Candidatus Dormibacteraeota bacterium]